MTNHIAIIGAGPAGIYAARLLADAPCSVTLFEQNTRIGKKLRTTGGGRMNVGNQSFTAAEFSSQQPNLLKRLFKNPHFHQRDAVLAELGIEFVWEGQRAILRSGDARVEVERLATALDAQENLTVQLNTKVTEVAVCPPDKGGLGGYSQEEVGSNPPQPPLSGGQFTVNGEPFDTVILTQGGMLQLGQLGSREQIYRLPMMLGHTTTAVDPSLGALMFDDGELRELAGVSFVGKLTDTVQRRSVTDDLLITHLGLSGPAALDFTARAPERESVELCFLPEISEEQLRKQVATARGGRLLLRGLLKELLPLRLVDVLLTRCGIPLNTQIANLKKTELQLLCKTLFHTPLPRITDNIYPSCWTTCGGVPLSEVKTATLESKLVPRLFFAGEVLDVNGLCGGYNIGFAAVSARIVVDKITQSQD